MEQLSVAGTVPYYGWLMKNEAHTLPCTKALVNFFNVTLQYHI